MKNFNKGFNMDFGMDMKMPGFGDFGKEFGRMDKMLSNFDTGNISLTFQNYL